MGGERMALALSKQFFLFSTRPRVLSFLVQEYTRVPERSFCLCVCGRDRPVTHVLGNAPSGT